MVACILDCLVDVVNAVRTGLRASLRHTTPPVQELAAVAVRQTLACQPTATTRRRLVMSLSQSPPTCEYTVLEGQGTANHVMINSAHPRNRMHTDARPPVTAVFWCLWFYWSY